MDKNVKINTSNKFVKSISCSAKQKILEKNPHQNQENWGYYSFRCFLVAECH